jgi:hypothetical protein
MTTEQTPETTELATAPTMAPPAQPAEAEVPSTYTAEQVDNLLGATLARVAQIDNARFARMILLSFDAGAALGYAHGAFRAFSTMVPETIDGELRVHVAKSIVTSVPTVPEHDDGQRQSILALARSAMVTFAEEGPPQRNLVAVFMLAESITGAIAGRIDNSRDPDVVASLANAPAIVVERAAAMFDAIVAAAQQFEQMRAAQQ